MKRREFVGKTIITAGAAAFSGWTRRLLAAPSEDSSQVKRVLTIFKCHLDVGFTDTQANVMRKYFDQYFPKAIKIGGSLRAAGEDRYVWTTGSWLLYEYLEQANTQDRRQMEQAIAAGNIAWHAIPFSWQTEMLDRSMIEGCLGLSASLDRRFGRKTTGAKMSDVPGHSRGIVSPLAAAGVKLLDIGVNSASTPPAVPDLFLWRDPEGNTLITLYHHHAYGGVVLVPNSDLAIAVEMKSDNQGPHTEDEIKKIYADLRSQFPNAAISANSLSEVANAVHVFRDKLPVVTQEIGDTWIYGVPSDPIKVARYRETARLRKQWIQQKHFSVGDATDRRLLSSLALAPEHTWGTDTKSYIDYDHYEAKDLKLVLDQPGYQKMERSWQEKRDDIDTGIATLPATLQHEANRRLDSLSALEPSQLGLHSHSAERELETAHFAVGIDPKTGAITKLRNKKSGIEWAAPEHPLALFTYQTLSHDDYAKFLANYVVSKASWAPRDFGKPEIERFGAESREWHPTLVDCWTGSAKESTRILMQLRIDDSASENLGRVAWPAVMYLELVLPDAEPVAHVTFSSFRKAPNRMPESMWLTFAPDAPKTNGWTVEKVDQQVSPSDVIHNGGRNMHAVTNHLRYQDGRGSFQLTTLDAPVVALGNRSPLNFSPELPDLQQGFHINLFNNAWGTNYPQWSGGDWAYRFTIAAG